MPLWKPPAVWKVLAVPLSVAGLALVLRATELRSLSLNAAAVPAAPEDGGLLSVRLGAPVYQAPAPARTAAPAGPLGWGEVYAFPNPAKGVAPVIHVEAPGADRVALSIYAADGELVHQAELEGPPALVDDGQGPQPAFEHAWTNPRPGVHYVRVTAMKDGQGELRKTIKLAVLR